MSICRPLPLSSVSPRRPPSGGVGHSLVASLLVMAMAAALGMSSPDAVAANAIAAATDVTKAADIAPATAPTAATATTAPASTARQTQQAKRAAGTSHAAATPPLNPTLPAVTDFAAHARKAASLDAPLIVLVSLRDCVYCGPIRQRELAPLVRTGHYEVREIGMDSTTTVRDFDGRNVSGIEWARAHGVKVSPTVLFFDTKGRQVAEPLIGAGLPDFYGAYLDDAIARGRAQIQASRGTTRKSDSE